MAICFVPALGLERWLQIDALFRARSRMVTTQVEAVAIARSFDAKARGARFWSAVRAFAVTAVISVIVYRHVLAKLVQDWWNDPNYSHAFAIPIFSIFVVWSMRRELLALDVRGTWNGLIVVASALFLLAVGVLGAELFLSRVSLLVFLAGAILMFFGSGYFRALVFPWSVLLLAVPIPTLLLNEITFPLQMLASKFATVLLTAVGVPVLRDGNVIQVPATRLEVIDACSGIRSLTSLIALALILGYLGKNPKWLRCSLMVLAVPVAVVANSIRIMGTGLLAEYWDPDKAEGFFHLFEGWIIFVFSVIVLLLLQWLLMRFWPAKKEVA